MSEGSGDTVWLNGALVAAGDASVSALDRGVLWGQGLFETLRSYGGRPWAFAEHHRRLAAGAEVLEVPIPDARDLEVGMAAVIKANRTDEGGVRVTITRGPGPASPHLDADGPPNVIITAWTLPDYSVLYRDGVDLVSMGGGGRPLAGVKSTSYGASVAGRIRARRAGADDVLFTGAGGAMYEATGANVVAVVGRRLHTPEPGADVLAGVTCAKVLELARSAGYEVVEGPMVVEDLFAADEVVLTSTLREVYPARSLDGRRLPRADVAERLRVMFGEAVRRELG